ncbi:MAG: hypothetical protein QM760_21070 [Nibricoccus sp.]
MNQNTLTYSNRIFGSISCDPVQITGRGSVLTPRLHLYGKLQASDLGVTNGHQVGLLIQDVTGSAVVDHAGGFQLFLEPCPVQRIVMTGSFEQNIELLFPVTPSQLEAIEQARNAGDVSLTLSLRVTYLVLSQSQTDPTVGVLPLRSLVDAGSSQAYIRIQIPQSIWAKNVLSGVGFGQVLLFEMPAFPVSAIATLGEAFEAAKRAHTMFSAGEYDLAVGLCRTAVQPLRNHLKKIKDRAGDGTSGDWAEKIGQATFDWLTIVTGKTHGVASAAAHEGSSGRFSRLDAQMILTTTVSLLAYAARLERLDQAK